MKVKNLLLFILALIIPICSLVGCSTPSKEYVIVSPDFLNTFQPLLATRPSEPELIEDVNTLEDVMHNSVAFQKAYYDFRQYSLSLEQAILSVFSVTP